MGITHEDWRAGRSVLAGGVKPGTAIATFGPNGRFPDNGGNSAIFVGYLQNDGIRIIDQYPHPSHIGFRDLPAYGPYGQSNIASAYSVIIVF